MFRSAGAQPLGGGFARPTPIPSRANLLARPNVGGSPFATSRRPGGWAPQVVNHGWARPSADHITSRHTTNHHGNTSTNSSRHTTNRRANTSDNDRRLDHGTGYYDWYHRSSYWWRSNYPRDYSHYLDHLNHYPYDAYLYRDRYPSQTGSGDSGSSYQSAPSSTVLSNEVVAAADEETAQAEQLMVLARWAFQKGDYPEAQRECERAIRLLPGNANMKEFCALCQFAQGKYHDAAASLYEVLAAGRGWDWATLSSFYTSPQTYTEQLRALERYVKEYPKDPAGRFVLAHHYLALEERDAAIGQLRELVELYPRDQVSPGILEAL
jgi:tetratricopeptide (TPR) repeat protein